MITLNPIVVSGRGVGQENVNKNMTGTERLLSKQPFPGTLNLVLDTPFILSDVQVYDDKNKHFAVRAKINGLDCLACRWKGGPLHVLEIISDVALRKALDLQDGMEVTLTLPEQAVQPLEKGMRKNLWRLFYEGREDIYYKNDSIFSFFSKQPILRFIHKRICQKDFEVTDGQI